MSFNCTAIDTRDNKHEHRFHAFPITRLVSGQVDKWYLEKHKVESLPDVLRRGFDDSYSELPSGSNCCSSETISFHYVEEKECRALYAIQHYLLDNPTISDANLKRYISDRWPHQKKEIGFYSRGLPDDEASWKHLLHSLRKIFTRAIDCD